MPDIDHIDAAPVGSGSVSWSRHRTSSCLALQHLSIQLHCFINVHNASTSTTCTFAVCSSYRLTSVYVYEFELRKCLVQCRSELSKRCAQSLAELSVLTDFGACPLVKLACFIRCWNAHTWWTLDALQAALSNHSLLGWT